METRVDKSKLNQVTGANKDTRGVKRILGWYNMIPSIIWSVINLTPVTWYCFTLTDYKTLYLFLAISLLPVFLKNAFLDRLQFSKTTKAYKQLGVHLVNKVAQNGVIINKLMKKKFPGYKAVTREKLSIAALISQTYVFEKFHLILFLFFCLVSFYAFAKGQWAWASIILFTNVAYNIYPNLLQQYIRLKLKLFNR